MKLGSLFDGSGGFPLAGCFNDIEPVWASDIEPFPVRVTQVRFPTEKQIRKWLSKPNSDTAEYKMWSNGIALPCALFVLWCIKEIEKTE